MTVYVGNARMPWRGKHWSHLVAESTEELHAFAAHLGLQRQWFQTPQTHPHYDVTELVREKALRLGAQIGDKRTIIDCCRRMREEGHAVAQRAVSAACVCLEVQ